MKQWLIIITVVALNITIARAESVPGDRPNMAPSWLEKLFGVSLEDKIIEQAKKVEKCRAKWKNIHLSYSDTEGFLWWKHSPKKEALEKLIKQDELLKNFLASTPSDSNKPKYVLIREKGGKGKEANQEIVEINLAMKNLRNLQKQMMTNPSDLDMAGKYYTCHVTCIVAIIGMHEEFVQNIETKYVPAIEKGLNSAQRRLEWIEKRLEENFENEQNRIMLQKSKPKVQQFLDVMQAVRAAQLPKLKLFLERKIPKLRENLEMARFRRDQVKDRKAVKDLFEEFSLNFEELAKSPPPLLDFEQDWSDFELPEPKSSDPNS